MSELARPMSIPTELKDRFPRVFADHRDGSGFRCPWSSGGKPKPTDLLKWQLGKNPFRAAKRDEEPVDVDTEGLDDFTGSDAAVKVLWLGHASFLVELDGWRCLIDPVYGTVGAFVKRFGHEPFPIADLPEVHAVFLSHGHYDHLDVQTLREVARCHPDASFHAPLNQDRYIPSVCGPVQAFDWWHETKIGPITASFVPMQHWHRRGAFDYNKALWGGWIFEGSQTVLHCGDSGYYDGFKPIGELFDIDIALMPVGAYEPRWFMKSQHMNPEDSLQAFRDLGADEFVAMHWGTYDLTDEPLNLGAAEIRRLAEGAGLLDRVHTPPPGGTLTFG